MTAIENEPQFFSACSDWPIHAKPSGKPKKPAKIAKSVIDPVLNKASVPVVAETVISTKPAARVPRQWTLSLRRVCWSMLLHLRDYLRTVIYEVLVRLGVKIVLALLAAAGILALLAYIGVTDIDDVKPPEPEPPITAETHADDWKAIVTPEPKNSKRK